MAHHASAKKRNRQTAKRAARNRHIRSGVRTAVRRARSAVEAGSDEAGALCHAAERALRRATSKHVLHPKTASRTVSRLQAQLHRAR